MPGELIVDLFEEQFGHPQIFPFHYLPSQQNSGDLLLTESESERTQWKLEISGSAEGRNEGPISKTGRSSKSSHIEFETLHSLVRSGSGMLAPKLIISLQQTEWWPISSSLNPVNVLSYMAKEIAHVIKSRILRYTILFLQR